MNFLLTGFRKKSYLIRLYMFILKYRHKFSKICSDFDNSFLLERDFDHQDIQCKMMHHKLPFWKVVNEYSANSHHKMQKTRNSCFRSKKRNTTFHQVKIGNYECHKISATYVSKHPYMCLYSFKKIQLF